MLLYKYLPLLTYISLDPVPDRIGEGVFLFLLGDVPVKDINVTEEIFLIQIYLLREFLPQLVIGVFRRRKLCLSQFIADKPYRQRLPEKFKISAVFSLT